MAPWWRQLNYRIKHQLYLRILPVAVIAVLTVGLFSGRLLTSRTVNTYLEQKQKEQAATLDQIISKIEIRALAAEAHKDEGLPRGAWTDNYGDLRQFQERENFLSLEGVLGFSLLPMTPWTALDSVSITLAPHLENSTNQDILAIWAEHHWQGFVDLEGQLPANQTGWPGGPRSLTIDAFHSLVIFEPLELELPRESPAKAWDESLLPHKVPVLPVFVREERDKDLPAEVSRRHPQLLILIDVTFLVMGTTVARNESGDVGLLLDTDGRLLAAGVDSLTAGYDLIASDHEVFAGVSGSELGRFLHQSEGAYSQAYLGRRWDPYVFMLTQRPDLPLLVVSALPFSEIHGGMVLYTAIVVLMAVIALLGSILAITSVGEGMSDRMQAMAINMEEVAKGDYSRRISVGKEDEVGRLISYFNLMTAALDEAHCELREKTQRLRLALARMKRLDKAKDDFLALISHEVRTPLTSIMGGVEFFKMVVPTATEQQKQLLEELNLVEITKIIESSGLRLSEFMNDAIMMTALQSSDAKANFTPVLLNDMFELVLSGLQDAIAAKQLTITNEFNQDSGWSALCDRDLMIAALDKLLHNAVQHNHAGGRVLLKEVQEITDLGDVEQILSDRSQRDMTRMPAFGRWQEHQVRWRLILIYNTGRVIPEEKRDSLFRKFEMVGRIEHHQKGSGLSLPIVQAIVEIHGGEIFVQSERDEGNYFYLLIPTLDYVDLPRSGGSGDDEGQGVGGTPGDKNVHLVGNPARLDVEFEHSGT